MNNEIRFSRLPRNACPSGCKGEAVNDGTDIVAAITGNRRAGFIARLLANGERRTAAAIRAGVDRPRRLPSLKAARAAVLDMLNAAAEAEDEMHI